MAQRDRYVDVLRALALVRVMTYHALGWAWLPLLFPSMGIMFALAGGLVAVSLDRASSARVFWRKRIRRLLPPFWLFGAVALAGMWALGWSVTEEAGLAFTWGAAWAWVLARAPPPFSAEGVDWVTPLWYIRTYLWFLLLSPALLWLFRRWPRVVLAAAPAVLAALELGLVPVSTATGDTLQHLGIFGTCWLLGFAHHDGAIGRLRRWRT